MIPSSFSYSAPQSIDEAVALLRRYGDEAKLLAGGHSLLPILKQRLASVGHLIDIGRIEGLAGLREEAGAIRIGAMTTHTAVARSPLLAAKQSLLSHAAAEIGDPQVRNRGTIGGSLAHADPAADLIPVVLVLDARMEIVGPSGKRLVRAGEFFESMYTTALEEDEILVAIRVPIAPANARSVYVKVPHKASHLPVVGVAAQLILEPSGNCESARIGLTGLAPIAYRASASEEILRGKALTPEIIDDAAQCVTDGVEPLSDFYASAEYRLHLARVHTARALRCLAERI